MSRNTWLSPELTLTLTNPKHKPQTLPYPLLQTLKSFNLSLLLLNPTNPNTTLNKRTQNIKITSPTKMQLCREKGLCFICDEKSYLVNRCPNKHYLLLKMEEDYMDNRTLDPIIENMETFTL